MLYGVCLLVVSDEHSMNRNTRSTIQYLHITGGAIIATYICSPWNNILWFDIMVKALVLPGIIISGLYMWPVTSKIFKK